jgi:hypothetical protein
MNLVTNKFKPVVLHEKHVVATWNLGNHLSICLETHGNQEKPVSRWPVAGPFIGSLVLAVIRKGKGSFGRNCCLLGSDAFHVQWQTFGDVAEESADRNTKVDTGD